MNDSFRTEHEWNGKDVGQWTFETCVHCGARRSHGYVGDPDNPSRIANDEDQRYCR